MKELNLDEQIEQTKAGIMKLQGQLELLLVLKQAGAVVQLPDESKPAPDTP
jgi:hypothetical protein